MPSVAGNTKKAYYSCKIKNPKSLLNIAKKLNKPYVHIIGGYNGYVKVETLYTDWLRTNVIAYRVDGDLTFTVLLENMDFVKV